MKSDNNYTFAIIVSVVLHLLLIAALIFGGSMALDDVEKPNMIEAVVIDPSMMVNQASQIRQERERAKQAEQERLKRLQQQAERLEKNRKAEEDRIRNLKERQVKEQKALREAEAELKKVEEQRKKLAEEAEKQKQQAIEEEKRRKVEADKQAQKIKAEKEKAAREAAEAVKKAQLEKERIAKAEADRKAKELAEEKARIAKEQAKKLAAEKARKEKERAIKAEAERKQQEAALNDIFAGLENESVQNTSAKQQHITDEVNRHAEIYRQMIQQNLLIDQTYIGKTCRVKIKLSSTGLLLAMTTLGGDAQVCRAAKTAITKVNVFPMPRDPSVVAKLTDINLTVQPE